ARPRPLAPTPLARSSRHRSRPAQRRTALRSAAVSRRYRHRPPARCSRSTIATSPPAPTNAPLRDPCDMRPHAFVGLELRIPAGLDLGETDPCRLAQGLELGAMRGAALLEEPQAFTQDLARVLVLAGLDQVLDQRGLAVGHDDIAGGHRWLRVRGSGW